MVLQQPLDCLIIGAGAAGLTAATYLARFRRHIVAVDGNTSRLLSIPTSHNYPGFIEGIHGRDLLSRLRAHASHYGAVITPGTVEQLQRRDDGSFVATGGTHQWHARTVILATGVVDVEPALPDVKRAVADGRIRYCPVCDGFESIGKKVAVLGRGKGGLGEAFFVRHYADEVSLFTLSEPIDTSAHDQAKVDQMQVRIVPDPVVRLEYGDNEAMEIHLQSGARECFDVVYAALGTMVNSGLAQVLGAKWTGNGELVVDSHQQTTVDGLYAIGDVVAGLNQIAVAMGHAAIAATAVHNRFNHWRD